MSTATIVVLILLTFTALIVVNAINVRQQHLRQLLKQQQKLYRSLEEAEDALATSLRTLEKSDVAEHINREITAILKRLIKLERLNPAPIQARIELAQKRQDQLATGVLTPQLNRCCNSDAEIATLQLSLAHAARIIHKRLAANQLSQEQAQQLLNQIDWGRLQISVLSLIAAGYNARNSAQITSALSYFQKAQDLLQSSCNPDPRRLELVRQLSAVMQNPKAVIDQALFPEFASADEGHLVSDED